MQGQHSVCADQYRLVMSSRDTLFGYCDTIVPEDLLRAQLPFGRGGSIRNLLVHNVNTYQHWVLNVGLHRKVSYTEYNSVKTVAEIAELFKPINEGVFTLIKFADQLAQEESYDRNGSQTTVSRLTIFTHVITHEFHHKGQILSLSRALGYTPIDTDVIR